MPKRTRICVRPTQCQKYKFEVVVPPEINEGAGERKFFVTRKEAQEFASDLQVKKENFGTCYDNAKMESFWATLKTELIDGQVYATRAEAKSAIFSYIEIFHTRVRLHGALDFCSPVDFEHILNQTSTNPALRLVLRTGARSQLRKRVGGVTELT